MPQVTYQVIQKVCIVVQVSKPSLSIESVGPPFAGGRYSPFEEEADDEDIWHSLCQPGAMTQVNPRQTDGKRAFEVSHHYAKHMRTCVLSC